MSKKKNPRFRGGLILVGVCALAACGPRPVSTTATIHFEASTGEEMAQAAKVLQARFRDLNPSQSSNVTAIVAQQDIVLEFRGESPADETIRYFATSRGVFRIYPLDSQRNWLVTDRDIEEVNARMGETGPVLELTVDESAAQRLLSFTSRNTGRILVTNWDGKEQSRAAVAGVFSRRFQTDGMDRDTALRMKIILQSGRLPIAVREIEILHPAPGGG